jgi:transposase
MIDYETYQRIKQLQEQDHLTAMQIAMNLQLDYRTVAKWLKAPRFHPRQSVARSSLLDPYKDQLVQWLEHHPYTAQQCFQRLRGVGYPGGYSILTDYIRKVRPVRRAAFLTLAFAPGECAQVDWGTYRSIAVGNTRRRLSFFVMVLCYSRLMYLEFTVLQTMEHFLACHQHAFEYFGQRVPDDIMVDNLRSAVLKRVVGEAPVFNPKYQAFADHYGFRIKACGVRKGNEKGRVENGVGYVKKNFLNGLTLGEFSTLHPAARHWLDETANTRIHGETQQRPIDRFNDEKEALSLITVPAFDVGQVHSLRASNQFRVRLDTNRYSVPAEYASQPVLLKTYPDRLCIYHREQLIARHPRSYERHRDIEHPDHPRELLTQRRNAREQQRLARFLSLSSQSQRYYQMLEDKRLNAKHHVQKIVALAEIYGDDKVARAITDACELGAVSCEYIANLLEQRARIAPEPSALHLTRNEDLLELTIQPPDLSLYDSDQGASDATHSHQPKPENG